MIKTICLSLSAACTGDCIFCPRVMGSNLTQKFMSFDTVEKIIKEISDPSFKQTHNLSMMQIGEIGDAFLHKDLISILRFMRSRMPKLVINVFTNFQHFSKDKIEIVLKENLINSFSCNIDGSNEKNYYLVKKLDYDTMQKNVKSFIAIRDACGSSAPLTIQVITAHDYIHAVKRKLRFYPNKITDKRMCDVPDDFNQIRRYYKKLIDPKKDRIVRSPVILWAEREHIDTKKLDYNRYCCPLLNRIQEEVFIAPDGTCYLCCLDAKIEVVLGNVNNDSIDAIFYSDKRKKLIDMLKNKKFAEIGVLVPDALRT